MDKNLLYGILLVTGLVIISIQNPLISVGVGLVAVSLLLVD